MKKVIPLLVLLLLLVGTAPTLFAETVILKTGSILTGEIVESTNDTITLLYRGSNLVLRRDAIFLIQPVNSDNTVETKVFYNPTKHATVISPEEHEQPNAIGPEDGPIITVIRSIYSFSKAETMRMKGAFNLELGTGFQYVVSTGAFEPSFSLLVTGSYWVREYFSLHASGAFGLLPQIAGTFTVGPRLHFTFARDTIRPYIAFNVGLGGYNVYETYYNWWGWDEPDEIFHEKGIKPILGVSASLFLLTLRRITLDIGHAQLLFHWEGEDSIPNLNFSIDMIRVGIIFN